MSRRRRSRMTVDSVAMVEVKAPAPALTSIQPRFRQDVGGYGFIVGLARAGSEIPPYGDVARDEYLADLWRREPILAGAVASMAQKVAGLSWTITGGRNRVARYSRLLADVQDGLGWTQFVETLCQDYLVRDNGAFVELGRESRGGAVADLFAMDSSRVRATGRRAYPYVYMPDVGGGGQVLLPKGDVVRLVSMPSPEERRLGLGFSAVSRAVRAARLLVSLHDYDWEKLSNLPPQGIASITGLTEQQVRGAMTRYDEGRKQRGQQTFPGVLWLASALPGGPGVQVAMTPFSELPDSFDRETVVNMYVYTLALAFGVDAREFWPATVTGATKADALVQATKAKGKGPAEIIQTLERFINFHVLPEGLRFEFDFQDDEEDERRANIHSLHVQNAVRLFTPPSPLATEGIVSRDEARRLLVDWGVLPDEYAAAPDEMQEDADVHKALREPLARARWRDGELDAPLSWQPNAPEVDWDGVLAQATRRLATMGTD